MAKVIGGKDLGFGVTVLLLLASCSAPPVDGADSRPDSADPDALIDAIDTSEVKDVPDSGNIQADLLVDVTNVDDVSGDDIGDSNAPPLDATSDVLVCADVPKAGCPCDYERDEPCCLMIAKGLSCETVRFVDDVLVYEWDVFWDCGCIDGPPCEGQEVYPLCPWESREEYY